jgi:hypothetical protein
MGRFYKIKQSSNPKKNTSWKWFSKYIKFRDAIKTTGDIYYAKCITCGEIHSIEDMDAGHGISGRANSILFNEYLVNAQCRKCNRHGGGELQMYKKILIDMYGQEQWDLWQTEKHQPKQFTNDDYESIAKTYKIKIKQLKEGNK